VYLSRRVHRRVERDKVAPCSNRPNGRFGETVRFGDRSHVESVGNDYAAEAELFAQETADHLRRQRCGQVGVDGLHKQVRYHDHVDARPNCFDEWHEVDAIDSRDVMGDDWQRVV
jgi:hypothetical protein